MSKQTIVYIHRRSAPIYDDKDAMIKQLQIENYKLKQQIQILENKKSYLKDEKLKDIIPLFTIPDSKSQIREYFVKTKSYTNQWAITLTLSPAKFPQLPFVPQKAQIEYFKKILTYVKQKDLIGSTYGCFEQHLNGNIHIHFITSVYCIDSFIKKIQKFITDKVVKTNKPCYYYSSASCAVKTIPSESDLNQWLDYIEKDPVELFTDVVMSYDYDSIFI